MSNSEDSMVTYTTAPPSPDYVSGPEYPPSPEFVLERIYPEFMPLEDEILPAEEPPLPVVVLPTADSPGYVPEEDPEEDDDEDPKEDPADYPADEGDDGDDEDESFDDDEDEDVDIEWDEEHPAPADSTAIALPAVDQAPSVDKTEPFETEESAATPPPYTAYHVTARISIRDETLISLPPREEVERLLAMPTPPSLLLSLCPIHPLGYRAAMIRLRIEAASTSHSLPLPPPTILSHTRPNAPSSGTPPLHLLSTDRRADIPEVTLPPQKRLGISLGPRYEGDYADLERDDWVMGSLTLGMRCWQDTNKIYTRLDDEQSGQQLMVGRLNMLYRDRRAHACTARLIEAEARMSREAWGRSMDASDLARIEVMSLRTQVVAQQAMTEVRETADPQRSSQPDAPEGAGLVFLVIKENGTKQEPRARDADKNTNGDDSHNSRAGVRRTEQTACECTYTDFLKCQPLNFKGTEGFPSISMLKNGVCFPHHNFVIDAKLEMEIWDLKVKVTDLTSYTQRFQELALLCRRMFPEESDKIEKYVQINQKSQENSQKRAKRTRNRMSNKSEAKIPNPLATSLYENHKDIDAPSQLFIT
ncbi:hypothetical protein Tco_0871148 [Tanacetum coccineum]